MKEGVALGNLPRGGSGAQRGDRGDAQRGAGERAERVGQGGRQGPGRVALLQVRHDFGREGGEGGQAAEEPGDDEQAGLRRQLQEQSDQVAQVGVEVTRARLGVESVEARISKLEQATQTIFRLLVSALVLLAGIAILAVVILLKQQAR